jgi:hypothetical protein
MAFGCNNQSERNRMDGTHDATRINYYDNYIFSVDGYYRIQWFVLSDKQYTQIFADLYGYYCLSHTANDRTARSILYSIIMRMHCFP